MPSTAVYLGVGATTQAIGTLVVGYFVATDAENRVFHATVAAVTGIAAVAYAAMALGIGAITVDGSQVFVTRYVDWALTTPLILLYLGRLAGYGLPRLLRLVTLDLVTIGAGFAARLTTGTTRWVLFGVGALAYVALLYVLVRAIMDDIAERPPPVRALFRKLRNLTVVIWSFYPVVWLIGPGGFDLVAADLEVALIVYLDVLSKVGFGLIAVNSRTALAELPDVDALRGWRRVGPDEAGTEERAT